MVDKQHEEGEKSGEKDGERWQEVDVFMECAGKVVNLYYVEYP